MTSLTLVRRIAARPDIVFAAVTTAEGIAHWWGPDDEPVLFAQSDPRLGGAFRARFRTKDGAEHECAGEFVEFIPPLRVAMSWRWTHGGEPEERGEISRVEIALRPIAEGTELTFTHTRLKTERSRVSHESGWIGALDKLVAHFAGRPGEGP